MKKYLLLFMCFVIHQSVAQTILPADSLLSTTLAGFKYINHTNQSGEKPKVGQFVLYHTQMRNGDKVIFSSRQQGEEPVVEMPSSQQAEEWKVATVQVLSLMGKGDSATTYLRIDTLKNKPRSLSNTDWLAYDIVCLDILDKADWEERQNADGVDHAEIIMLMDSLIKAYKNKTTRAQMTLETTRSGLKYLILKEGIGNFPTKGKNVAVHYAGYLRSGRLVDSSTEQNNPFIFPLSQGVVIEGWDEGIPLLREGTEAAFFIPSRLAYGEKGSLPKVPPHAEMIYYIKVVKVP